MLPSRQKGFNVELILVCRPLPNKVFEPIRRLYPLLSRLRREGVVETTWRESPGGPPRRYYALTPAGRAVLDVFTGEWARFRDTVDGIIRP